MGASHDALRGQKGCVQTDNRSAQSDSSRGPPTSLRVCTAWSPTRTSGLTSVYDLARSYGANFDFWPVNDAEDLYLRTPEELATWRSAVAHIGAQEPEVAERAAYYEAALGYHAGEDGPVRCLGLIDQYGVTYTGELLPCCVWGGDGLAVGNVFETPLSELWHSDAVQQSRHRMFEDGCDVGCYNHSLYRFEVATGVLLPRGVEMKWVEADFKGKTVWAQVHDGGNLVVEGGRIPIRYSDKAGAKIYRAGQANIRRYGAHRLWTYRRASRPIPVRRGSPRDQATALRASEQRRRLRRQGLLRSSSRALIPARRWHSRMVPARATLDLRARGAVSSSPTVLCLSARWRSAWPPTMWVSSPPSVSRSIFSTRPSGLRAADRDLRRLQSTYGLLELGWKAKSNTELVMSLRDRLKGRKIRLHWVAGHVGIPENERADELANEGVQRAHVLCSREGPHEGASTIRVATRVTPKVSREHALRDGSPPTAGSCRMRSWMR